MRKEWMDLPHEFREDIDDYSMCECGVPGLTHDLWIDSLRVGLDLDSSSA